VGNHAAINTELHPPIASAARSFHRRPANIGTAEKSIVVATAPRKSSSNIRSWFCFLRPTLGSSRNAIVAKVSVGSEFHPIKQLARRTAPSRGLYQTHCGAQRHAALWESYECPTSKWRHITWALEYSGSTRGTMKRGSLASIWPKTIVGAELPGGNHSRDDHYRNLFQQSSKSGCKLTTAALFRQLGNGVVDRCRTASPSSGVLHFKTSSRPSFQARAQVNLPVKRRQLADAQFQLRQTLTSQFRLQHALDGGTPKPWSGLPEYAALRNIG